GGRHGRARPRRGAPRPPAPAAPVPGAARGARPAGRDRTAARARTDVGAPRPAARARLRRPVTRAVPVPAPYLRRHRRTYPGGGRVIATPTEEDPDAALHRRRRNPARLRGLRPDRLRR